MAERASYDYRGLGRLLRIALEADGRGWRACAGEIGVTASDLSRVGAGQAVGFEKVAAICDWLGISDRTFYRRFPANTLKQQGAGLRHGGLS